MRTMRGGIFKVAILSALIMLVGWTYYNQSNKHSVLKDSSRAAWLTYWDLGAGEKDLEKADKKLSKLSYFGAFFDKDDRLFIPQELLDKRTEKKVRKVKYESYLTFVNDKQNLDGSVVLKDIEVLRRLFKDDTLLQKHIDELIAVTLQGEYDGIEIDYERIWKDENLGKSFLKFADKLYGKALENNLKLRIVLEPSTPFSMAGFFQGPEYVVMLYNLYGLHSPPGPKADKKFIQNIVSKMEGLPGEKSVALSTGGCVWGSNGEKRFLTEVEAKTLAVTHDIEPTRDKDSQCLVLSYKDMGVAYQVWYADVKTVNYWIGIVKEQGRNNISLWRLGGNIDIHKIQ